MADKMYAVKVDGIEIPMTIDKLIANAGRGVLAARNKNYDSRYKSQSKRFEAIKDLTDEEIVAIRDAKKGNTKAFEYLGNMFTPNVDEDADYIPTKLPTVTEEYSFVTAAKKDGSYEAYEKVINGFGSGLYNELNAIADSAQKETALEGLYKDVKEGVFNKVIGPAISISDSGGKTQLEAYLEAVNSFGDTNQNNATDNYANRPEEAIQPSVVDNTFTHARADTQPVTQVPDAMADHHANREQMRKQFG